MLGIGQGTAEVPGFCVAQHQRVSLMVRIKVMYTDIRTYKSFIGITHIETLANPNADNPNRYQNSISINAQQ